MDAEAVQLMTSFAALAPTIDDERPWYFVVVGHTLHVRADRVGDEESAGRAGAGAAVEFARLALRSLGYACTVRLAPRAGEPTLLATLTEGHRQPATAQEQRLIEAIPRWHAGPDLVADQHVPDVVLRQLRESVAERGCWLRLFDAALLPHGLGAGADQGAVLVLGTDTDDPLSQLRVGRALAYLVLHLVDSGVVAQLCWPVAEIPTVRARLRLALGVIGYPQLMLKIRSQGDSIAAATAFERCRAS
jgi:hypothetical protein